jgi:hypothetical protein
MRCPADHAHRQFVLVHFGRQCAWFDYMHRQAEQAAHSLGATLEVYDVYAKPETATQYNLWFPFMLVVDDRVRIASPMSQQEILETLQADTFPMAPVMCPGQNRYTHDVKPLLVGNLEDAERLCLSGAELSASPKHYWMQKFAGALASGVFGFASYECGRLAAAVEYLPSTMVPYPLSTKHPEHAFITCVYPFGQTEDFRAEVLTHLCEWLSANRFSGVSIAAGRSSTYPNGPASFLSQLGFDEVGLVDDVVMKVGRDYTVLMHKSL